MVRNGKLKLQRETGIVGALKILAQGLDKSQNNVIVIISDMLEFSPDANCYQLVDQPHGALPEPPAGLLAGARVIALGAGYGVKNSIQNDRLQSLWDAWFDQCGVNEFNYLTAY